MLHPAETTPAAHATVAVPWRRPAVAGRGLAEAVRRMDEGAALLAAARRDGRGHDG